MKPQVGESGKRGKTKELPHPTLLLQISKFLSSPFSFPWRKRQVVGKLRINVKKYGCMYIKYNIHLLKKISSIHLHKIPSHNLSNFVGRVLQIIKKKVFIGRRLILSSDTSFLSLIYALFLPILYTLYLFRSAFLPISLSLLFWRKIMCILLRNGHPVSTQ